MKRKNRKFVKFMLLLTFAVSAPIVLLFASGYRYNWHKHKIEKTGIVYVDTEPEKAFVTIDDKPAKETTPVSISNLLPEDYKVTISKDRYLTWTKTLPVESGRTTFAKDVTLLRDEIPHLIRGAAVTAAEFSKDGTAVAYLAEDQEWNEISVYDIRTGDTLLLARFARDKYTDTDMKFSPDGSFLMFSGHINGKTGESTVIYPLNIAGRGINVAPDMGGSSGLSTVWSLDGSSMVAFGKSGIFKVDIPTGNIDPLPAGRSVRDAFITKDYIWIVREGEDTDLLERIDTGGGSAAESFIALPRKGYSIVGGNDRYIVMTDGRANGGLLIDTFTGGMRAMPHATGLEWEQPDRTGRLLIWNDFEIFVADPDKQEMTLITRIGTGIGNCVWHPESKYIFHSDDTGINAIEMDSRDRRNIYRLFEFSSVDSISIDREAEVLRFTGSIGNQRGIFERPL